MAEIDGAAVGEGRSLASVLDALHARTNGRRITAQAVRIRIWIDRLFSYAARRSRQGQESSARSEPSRCAKALACVLEAHVYLNEEANRRAADVTRAGGRSAASRGPAAAWGAGFVVPGSRHWDTRNPCASAVEAAAYAYRCVLPRSRIGYRGSCGTYGSNCWGGS